MCKLLNSLNLKIGMKSFIFCNNLLEEKPHTLFLGLLSWKQKQNKKPDILKVYFHREDSQVFCQRHPHWSLEYCHLFGGGGEMVQSRVFLLLLFRLLLCSKQYQKISIGRTFKKYSGYSCRFGIQPGKCVLKKKKKTSQRGMVISQVWGLLKCTDSSPNLIRMCTLQFLLYVSPPVYV